MSIIKCFFFCAGGELYATKILERSAYTDDVLEFDAEKGVWNKIGSMSIKKVGHALSVINYEDIQAYCNWKLFLQVWIFEKFILYFNVTYYPQFNKMYYMLVKLHSNPLCLLKALCRAAISIYVLQSIFTDLINYRIDLDRKMLGWVSEGSAKEYSDEL